MKETYQWEPLFPPTVGAFVIGNMHFYQQVKPCWFHRKMLALCLGIQWEDEK